MAAFETRVSYVILCSDDGYGISSNLVCLSLSSVSLESVVIKVAPSIFAAATV